MSAEKNIWREQMFKMAKTNPYLNAEYADMIEAPTGTLDLFLDVPTQVDVDIDLFLQHFTQSYGLTGGGKSQGMGRDIEELLLKKTKLGVVDKKGEYTGLVKLRGCSVKVVKIPAGNFDEEKEQLEMRIDQGEALATEYLKNKDSIVIDLSGERAEDYLPFLNGFFGALWQLRREEKAKAMEEGEDIVPTKIFIDEAHNFLPLNVDSSLSTKLKQVGRGLINHLKAIGREGRSYGLTAHISSQRPSYLDSTIRAQGEVFFFHKQTYPNELEFYLKMTPHDRSARNQMKEEFSTMAPGFCYFVRFGKADYVRFKKKRTPDLSKTPGYAQVMGWKHG